MVDGGYILHPRNRLHMCETGNQYYNDFATFLFNSGTWIWRWGLNKNSNRDSFGTFMLLYILIYIQFTIVIKDDEMFEE